MTLYRPFCCDDLFRINNINLDPYTEQFSTGFYLHYLVHWPEYFIMAESYSGTAMSYIMGKAEHDHEQIWHGHITAVSVAEDYRRLGIAANLIEQVEAISEKKKCYYVDLYVRASNTVAVKLYEKLGYIVYRRIKDYYGGTKDDEQDEDGLDMRKSLSMDPEKKCMVPYKIAKQTKTTERN